MEEHTEEARAETEATRLPVSAFFNSFVYHIYDMVLSQIKIAVWASLVANLALCVLQRKSATTILFR